MIGESHGTGVGVIVDGCPPRIPLTVEDVQKELDRRKPGQSRLTTPRDEDDMVEIMSGVYNGLTLGTPIGMVVRNKDQRSKDYDDMAAKYRPSHADATYDAKYGVRAIAGGGRSSARETIGRVAAGAIAKKLLKLYSGVEIIGYVQKVQDIELMNVNHDTVTEEQVI
jgi:chorismate synthase